MQHITLSKMFATTHGHLGYQDLTHQIVVRNRVFAHNQRHVIGNFGQIPRVQTHGIKRYILTAECRRFHVFQQTVQPYARAEGDLRQCYEKMDEFQGEEFDHGFSCRVTVVSKDQRIIRCLGPA